MDDDFHKYTMRCLQFGAKCASLFSPGCCKAKHVWRLIFTCVNIHFGNFINIRMCFNLLIPEKIVCWNRISVLQHIEFSKLPDTFVKELEVTTVILRGKEKRGGSPDFLWSFYSLATYSEHTFSPLSSFLFVYLSSILFFSTPRDKSRIWSGFSGTKMAFLHI